ncbi:choice-of-anchor L domain-containing protein, partial [Phaeodactylibacter sp.]
MKNTKIYTLCFLLSGILIIVLCSAFRTNPITIQHEGSASRHLLQMRGNTKEVELCNLQIGEDYKLRLSGIDGATVNFVQADGSLANPISFTAEEDCHTLLLQKEAGVDEAVAVYLSVSRRSRPPQTSAVSRANLQVQGGQSAQSLIENIFIGGGCFDVANATIIGNPVGVGSFSNGNASIGIGNGIILSTGSIQDAPGPNNFSDEGTDLDGVGNPDLEILSAPFDVFDANGISFQFTPTVSQINFNFVFASEEYCEFVGDDFNDVFGFFISGPGINGGFSMNGENIALVPGTNDAISINTINEFTNSNFYISNTDECGGTFFNQQDIQFDGFTTVLSAIANVLPCEQYTIQLIIGDGTDNVYDSAVFLQANSFNAGGASSGEAFSPTTNSNITFEACSDGSFILGAGGDISTDRVINFSVSPQSTATAGVDYLPFGTSVTVPAGLSEVTLPVTVLPDNIIEGQETIILDLQSPCSCTSTSIELIIEDVPPLSAEVLPLTVCEGASAELDVTVDGGLPGYSYAWSTGASGASIVEFPTQTTTYTVTVTDDCGEEVTASAEVTVTSGVTENISAEICDGESFSINGTDYTTTGTFTEVITVGSFQGCDSTIVLNLTVASGLTENIAAQICDGESFSINGVPYSTSGTFTEIIPGGSFQGCDSTVILNLTVNPPVTENIAAQICDGESFSINGVPYSTTGTFTEIIPGGSFQGCDSTVILNLTVNPPVTENISAQICDGESFSINGVPYSTSGTFTETIPGGSFQGCDSTVILNLTVNPAVTENIAAQICDGESFSINGVPYSSTGTFTEIIPGGSFQGCDSTIILDLTVISGLTENIAAQICNGESFSINGVPYSTTGTFTEIIPGGSFQGCDSTVILNLTVNPPVTENISAQICDGESFSINGVPYFTSGTFTETIPGGSFQGCDSTVVLNLTV